MASIERSKQVPLARFLMGLGIRQVGRHIANVLAKEFGSLDAIMAADKERLESVKEIGPEISSSLVSFFQEASNRRVIEQLRELGLSIEESAPQRDRSRLPLSDQVFVFTGGLEAFGREEAKALVEQLGGTVSSSVGKHTTYVVAGREAGSKLDRARELGVRILNEDEFRELVKPALSSG
jgi:DNA ligase (NAD+)